MGGFVHELGKMILSSPHRLREKGSQGRGHVDVAIYLAGGGDLLALSAGKGVMRSSYPSWKVVGHPLGLSF